MFFTSVCFGVGEKNGEPFFKITWGCEIWPKTGCLAIAVPDLSVHKYTKEYICWKCGSERQVASQYRGSVKLVYTVCELRWIVPVCFWPHFSVVQHQLHHFHCYYPSVATAQGKQSNLDVHFSMTGLTQGYMPKQLKSFLRREFFSNTGKILKFLKIKWRIRVVEGYNYNLFELLK